MTIFLISALSLSLLANGLLAFFLIKKDPAKKPQMSYDVQALLRDLSTGPALLKVEYLDRADVLLRSPRNHQ